MTLQSYYVFTWCERLFLDGLCSTYETKYPAADKIIFAFLFIINIYPDIPG